MLFHTVFTGPTSFLPPICVVNRSSGSASTAAGTSTTSRCVATPRRARRAARWTRHPRGGRSGPTTTGRPAFSPLFDGRPTLFLSKRVIFDGLYLAFPTKDCVSRMPRAFPSRALGGHGLWRRRARHAGPLQRGATGALQPHHPLGAGRLLLRELRRDRRHDVAIKV